MATRHSPLWPNRLIKPPYGAVEIDWAHPLAPDRSCLLLNQQGGLKGVDLASSRVWDINQNGGEWTVFGRKMTTGTGGFLATAASPVSGLSACSVLVRIRYWTNAGSAGLAGSYSSTTDMSVLLYTGSADVALWRVDTTTATSQVVTGTTLVQESGAGVHTIAGTYDGAYIRLYVNGKEEGVAAALTGIISTPSTTFAVGNYQSLGTGVIPTGIIEHCYIASRAWTAAEIAQLHADPYCFLRPHKRRSYGIIMLGTGTAVGPEAKASADALGLLWAEAFSGSGAPSLADAIPAAIAESLSVAGVAALTDAIALALQEALAGASVGALVEMLAPIIAEQAAAAGSGASADEVAALLLDAVAVDGTGTLTDAVASVLVELLAGSGTVSVLDTLIPVLQEQFAGTATGTLLDALVAYLEESYLKAEGVASYTAQDILSLLAVEVETASGTVTGTDQLEAVLTSALTGTATVTIADVAAAIIADALSVLGSAASADEVAAVIVEAYSKAEGIIAYTSADALTIAVAEAPGAAVVGTLTSVDALLADLREAILADGAVTAADALAPQLIEAGVIPQTYTAADVLALVLAESGSAVILQAISPFIVSVLVATWPTRQLTNKTTGWPYTLVQKAA